MQVNIAAAQYPITFHQDFASWKAHVTTWVENAVSQQAQLLLFPEYGSMELVSIFEQSVREDIKRQIVELDQLKDQFCEVWIDLARKYNIIIVAPSIPVFENGQPVNRAFVFSSKGLVGYQDKLFMTRFENEIWGIAAGERVLSVFETDWGCFGIQICYDVEFPIGAQLLAANQADILLAPSCTETLRGASRVHVGARARAMENQMYSVVSQTINDALWSPAVDVNFGYAAVYSTPDKGFPEDGIVKCSLPQKEEWLVQSLDFELINEVRQDGQVFNYKDFSRIKMTMDDQSIKVVKHQV